MAKTKTDKAPEPMDPTYREASTGTPNANHERVCYSLETLVTETLELFPETSVEYSNYDGRNTALDGTFDASMLDAETFTLFSSLLELVEVDQRVSQVITHGDDQMVLVSITPGARTQDVRAPFLLADALEALTEGGSL